MNDKNSLYLYGITRNDKNIDHFPELKKMGLTFIQYDGISAIVEEKKYVNVMHTGKETLARLLVNHQQKLEQVMELGFSALIPFKLGTWSTSEEEVRKILEKGYALCPDILKKVDHHVEVDVAVTWKNLNAILQQMANDPEIAELRQEIVSRGTPVSTADQVQIGKLIKEKLDKKTGHFRELMIKRLEPYSKELKQHELMDDQMVANIAFLLDRDHISLFEETVSKMDEEMQGEFNFKVVGPLPCYSFYTLEVIEFTLEEINRAKRKLGISEQASANDIRQAYLTKVKTVHPDSNHGNGNENYFIELTNAYKLMNDYLQTQKTSAVDETFYFGKEQANENTLIVKLKE